MSVEQEVKLNAFALIANDEPRKLLSIRINSLCLSILLLSAKFKHLNSRGETERKLAL